jgi:hypothetical protein
MKMKDYNSLGHTFNATDIQPGIYLIRVQVNDEDVTTQKLLIQK